MNPFRPLFAPAFLTVALLLAANLRAGTFSTTAWTDDSTTYIANGATLWAYHFGSTTTPTVNGVSVPGFDGPTASNANFDLTGTTTSATVDDPNNVTGTGSAEIARRFISGGTSSTVIVKGLTPGLDYTVSFFSVGFSVADGRRVTFSSGTDTLLVNQVEFGNDNGIRVDYTFTATTPTQTITLTPQVAGNTWHHCGIALRREFSPAPIPIVNPSFETPTLAFNGFTSNLNGWTNSAGAGATTSYIEHTSVTPAQGQNYLGMELGASVYQDLNVTYVANTVYVLRVSVGHRSGFTSPGNLSTYSLTDPDASATVTASYDAHDNVTPNTFFAPPPLAVNTAVYPALVGKPIRIRLSSTGVGRSHFDHVQISTTTVTTVANTHDSGAGSLRWALANAADRAGPDTITFNSSLSGGTILLTSGEFQLADTSGVTVDATSLPAGLTISGNGTSRIFNVNIGQTLALRALTLTGGNGTGESNNSGGAILNRGNLTLTQCTLYDNAATGSGGSINNSATLFATHCTFSANHAGGNGGAIGNNTGGSATFTNCTFFDNQQTGGTQGGGAINHAADAMQMTIIHCTIAGNNATGSQGGGGIRNRGPSLTLQNCIVSGNTLNHGTGTGPDMFSAATITRIGANIIPFAIGGTFSGPDHLTDDPLLAPLGHYGGPTQTMALMPGSPALDAATVLDPPLLTDQRGFPRNRDGAAPAGALPDIGAYEAQAAPSVENPNPILVTTATDELDPIGTPGNGLSLREALRDAPSGAVIVFDASLNNETLTLATALGGEIRIAKNVTIDAITLPAGFTISGNGTSRIFTVNSGQTVALRALTLTGGNGTGAEANGSGGAIFNSGTLTMTQCTLAGNSATSVGGAIFNSNGTLTMTQCTLDGNSANFGGAIFNSNGTLTMSQCTLAGNNANSNGGAIYDSNGTLTMTQCTLSGNSANIGGAIFDSNGTLTMTQCTLSGNSANFGGAIYNSGTLTPTLTLTHCTLAGNTAHNIGGAIYNTGLLVLQYTIAAGNTAINGADIYNHNVGTTPTYTRSGANIVQSVVNNGTVTESGPAAITDAPLLAPLDHYGGPTQTMALMPGSPALDAATVLNPPLLTDQRGFPRNRDGDATAGALPDIGAYEAQAAPSPENPNPILVTTAADELDAIGTPGTGLSLREALRDAPNGAVIVFDASLNGATLTLTTALGGEILIAKSVTIDGTTLPAGFTISGNGTSRIFNVNSGQTLALRALTLTGGNATGAGVNNFGGAILNNNGTLTMTQCTLAGNSATSAGGAIFNENGTLTMSQCTLAGNNANSNGGAISNFNGTLTMTQCTLSGNSAKHSGNGGAIFNNFGTLTMTQCTLAGNSALQGGAIYNFGTLTLQNTIVAGNTAPIGANIYNHNVGITPTYTRSGANVVQSVVNNGTVTESGPAAIIAAPLLAPLGHYGGPTQTMALMPGSPARDAAVDSTITTDQRGFPVVGIPDIGAYEAGTLAPNYNAFIWESLPTTASVGHHDGAVDFDGDGQTNEAEWVTLTDPGTPNGFFRLAQGTFVGATFHITFPTAVGRVYQLQSSPTLGIPSWTNVGDPVPGTGGNVALSATTTGSYPLSLRAIVVVP